MGQANLKNLKALRMKFLQRFRKNPDVRTDPEAGTQSSELKSDSAVLIEQYKILHQMNTDYGRSSERLLGAIQTHVEELGTITNILDFGCGRSRLVDWLAKLNDAKGLRYDPAIPEFDQLPVEKADLVINTDVLEHIPEETIDTFLSRIAAISDNAYFQIATDEAHTILPNGENAHCTVRPPEWWLAKLNKHFTYLRYALPKQPNRVAFVTWRKKSKSLKSELDAYLKFADDLRGRDCIVIGSAPNVDFEKIETTGKKIICCNGAALTLQERLKLSPDYTFIHSHVPWRINNPADSDVREALNNTKNLGNLVILFHPKHTYDPNEYLHQSNSFYELNWEYRHEIIRQLTGSSIPALDNSTGAIAVAAVAFANAKSIQLLGFSFSQNGHSYNNKSLHRAHVSSDAALFSLLHAAGYDIDALEPSVRNILTNLLSTQK